MASTKTKAKIKCEFDKESMYNKIMPTARKMQEAEDGEEVVTNPLVEEHQKAVSEAGIRSMTQTAKKEVHSTSGIQITQPQKATVLINVTEYAVNRRINDAFAKFKSCRCDRCVKDVAAIALNKLPSKYVVVEEDKIDEIVETQAIDVIPALVSAIMTVKTNPRH